MAAATPTPTPTADTTTENIVALHTLGSSRASRAEAVHEVDRVPVGVEGIDEGVLLLHAKAVPSDVGHSGLGSCSQEKTTNARSHDFGVEKPVILFDMLAEVQCMYK